MPEGYFGQYITIGIFAVIGGVLVGGTLLLSKLVRPDVRRTEKLTTYESGIDPIGVGWTQANVRYYIFALMFVIFDVEAVFLFPWALVFERVGTQALIAMALFIIIPTLDLVYAIQKGALRWQR